MSSKSGVSDKFLILPKLTLLGTLVEDICILTGFNQKILGGTRSSNKRLSGSYRVNGHFCKNASDNSPKFKGMQR
jgi:hypothetical protein